MTKRLFAALAAAAMLTSSLVLTTGAVASKSKGKADKGVAYFSVVHTANGLEYAAGEGTDKVLGNAAATYTIKAGAGAPGTVKVTIKKVTLYTGTGSLVGTASATLTITGTSEAITDGKLKLTKGFGSLKGHSLIATYTGTGNATTNQYKINYTGTYK